MSDDSPSTSPGLGRDCLFEDKSCSHGAGSAPQTLEPSPQALVQYGYKRCTRKTYFIRLLNAPIPSDSFAKHGQLSLRDLPPQDLLRALYQLHQWVECQQHGQGVGAQADRFVALDIAWTCAGLASLGLDPRLLRVFRRKSRAFTEGAWSRAAQHAGDIGASECRHWHTAYQEDPQSGSVALILVAHFAAAPPHDGREIAPSEILVTTFEEKLCQLLLKHAASCTAMSLPLAAPWIETSQPLDWAGTVYFGYKDGVTRPQFSAAGLQDPFTPNEKHAWGEVLLGHKRNQHDNPYGHLDLPPAAISPHGLKWKGLSHKEEQELHFFKNSSFAVFRKMQQKEDVFDAWVQQQAIKLCPKPAELDMWKTWVKAKVMGRMPRIDPNKYPHALPAGTRLTPDMRPEHLLDKRALVFQPHPLNMGREGGFRYPPGPAVDDPLGLGCPYASHIRRMNPKDDPVVPFTARPLLRRGMTYEEGTPPSEVGLSGLFICADIEAQFEHLVGRWANHRVMGVVDDSNGRDPIIGQHQEDGLHLSIENKAPFPRQQLGELTEPFVLTRGCVYAWFPSKKTLAELPRFLRNRQNVKPSDGDRLA